MSSKQTYALLVPCYNAENYIEGFLDNLQKLTKSFDEVIFYDDASTDDTLAILTSKGMKVIAGETNKGPGYARNRLAELSKSVYLHFHDIDDEFNPLFLNLTDSRLSVNRTDVILGHADWINAVTREVIIKWRYDENEIDQNPLAYFIANPLGVINTLYKRSVFLRIGGFNEIIKCWEDADLHIRLAAEGASFAVIDEILAFSLRHDRGISKDQRRCWICRLEFFKSYLDLYTPLVDQRVLRTELKKIQTAFIHTAVYDKLNMVMSLNKKFRLGIKTHKVFIIYYLNKIVPTQILKKALTFYNSPAFPTD